MLQVAASLCEQGRNRRISSLGWIAGPDESSSCWIGGGRDELVKGLLDVTDRIASFEWNLEEAKQCHLELNRQMNAQVDVLRALD